jgi:DNA topoisomerase I
MEFFLLSKFFENTKLLYNLPNMIQENNAKVITDKIGLIYIHDDIPGIKRKKSGKQFVYFDTTNQKITDHSEINRIKKLAIPPIYNHVWISPLRNSHLQATGIDKRGRKQYKYHQLWSNYTTILNHQHIINFGKLLPKIRSQIQKDLQIKDKNLHKNKVLATVVYLLDITLIRIGNAKYANENNSFGLTTLRKKHIKIESNSTIIFEFDGKSHQHHHIEIINKKLYEIVNQSMEIPGYELFKYFDVDRKKHDVTSTDINEYLYNISGSHYTAKDFRTWWATVLALTALETYEYDQKHTIKNIANATKFTSHKLGNTPSVCKKHYIYPGLLECYASGKLKRDLEGFDQASYHPLLSMEECKTLYFLQQHTIKNTHS